MGDIEDNARLIAESIDRARAAGAQLVVLPEQAITGYPAEDLWLKPHFLDAVAPGARGARVARRERSVALVGFPERDAATLQLAGRAGRRRASGFYRKALLAQLQRLRRAPLLRARGLRRR